MKCKARIYMKKKKCANTLIIRQKNCWIITQQNCIKKQITDSYIHEFICNLFSVLTFFSRIQRKLGIIKAFSVNGINYFK